MKAAQHANLIPGASSVTSSEIRPTFTLQNYVAYFITQKVFDLIMSFRLLSCLNYFCKCVSIRMVSRAIFLGGIGYKACQLDTLREALLFILVIVCVCSVPERMSNVSLCG